MKTVETVTIWVCGCCLMAAVNGEPCQCCADHEEDGPCQGCEQHPDTLMGSINPEDNVTAGMMYAQHNEGCLFRTMRSDAPNNYECDCETDGFSWHPCEGCGTNLAGSRHAMTLWIGENK